MAAHSMAIAAAAAAATATLAFAATSGGNTLATTKDVPWADVTRTPPTRDVAVSKLREAGKRPLDMLVVGGGATGCGVALDAATRGLNVGLVEQADFAAGTSSRSTKLVHGGVRYLEKAVFQADINQLKLVFEALHERKTLLQNATHLSGLLPTLTPCYQLYEVPYYWAGMKMYDLVAYASGSGLGLSRFVSTGEAKRLFPTLAHHRADGASLKGTIVYYDGQFDDSRMCVSLACSAAMAGAAVANYTRVVRLLKDDAGVVVGARVRDDEAGKEFDVRARVVVNATGIHTDALRRLSNAQAAAKPMISPSSGVHITLPDFYSPDNTGLIIPKTKDGRVVFMLPWMGATIAGTTDAATAVTMRPQATKEEVAFILDAISDYLTVDTRQSDVLSAWAGIRPLASDPTQTGTENISRDHVVCVEADRMVTITGGKWTTYRRMAQDAVDTAVEVGALSPARGCATETLPVLGSVGYTPDLFTTIAQNYTVPHRPGMIDTKVAKHLAAAYGDRAPMITKIAEERKLGKRLVRGHPMLEAEVVYAARHEYCLTAHDFLAHRTRLAFLDVAAARAAVPRVVELMGDTLGWGRWRKRAETAAALQFLDTFAP